MNFSGRSRVLRLVALVVVHSVTFLIGRRIGRYNVVDVAWGLGFVVDRRGRRGARPR